MNLGVIKHHLKIFLKFIYFSFISQMSFRFNFLFGYLIDFGWFMFMFFFFRIFYLNIPEIAGWNYLQILILLATYQIYTCFVYGIFVIFNLRRLPKKIWTGELDLLLLKPVNSQFHVSTREIWFAQFLNLIPSIILIKLGLSGLHIKLSMINILFYLIAVCSGILIVYGLWFMVTCLTFFFENAEDLPYIPQQVVDYIIEFPIDIFQNKLKFFLTWFIPLAFIASFPARILMGTLSPIFSFYGVLLAVVFLYLSNRFWKFSLKYYSSASS